MFNLFQGATNRLREQITHPLAEQEFAAFWAEMKATKTQASPMEQHFTSCLAEVISETIEPAELIMITQGEDGDGVDIGINTNYLHRVLILTLLAGRRPVPAMTDPAPDFVEMCDEPAAGD